MTENSIHIEGFRIRRLLSKHKHADVYCAVEHSTNNDCAIKIASSKEGARRILKEIQLLRRFEHISGIAQCLNSGISNEMPFLVMPLYKQTLHQFARQNKVNIQDAMSIMEQLVEAITHVHLQGVLHCDLHPKNIMQDKHWHIIDFAGAVSLDQEDFASPRFEREGTLLYASPEQREGLVQLSFEADVYALSSMFCALITSEFHENLFKGEDIQAQQSTSTDLSSQKVTQLIAGAHQRWLNVDAIAHNRALQSVLLKGLATDPQQRYSSAAQLYQALQQACEVKVETGYEDVSNDASFDTTIEFTHSEHFSHDIAELKKAILDTLLLEGRLNDDDNKRLIKQYQLAAKLSHPEQVMQTLTDEAYAFLSQNTEHAAFFEWTHKLYKYAHTYGYKISRKSAEKLIQQGMAEGAGTHQRLQGWLSRHFKIESWLLANRGRVIGFSVIAGLLIFVWYPQNPFIYDQAVSLPPKSSVLTNEGAKNLRQNSATASTEILQSLPHVQPSDAFVQSDTRLGSVQKNENDSTQNQTQKNIQYTVVDSKTSVAYTLTFNYVGESAQAGSKFAQDALYVMTEEVSQGLWLACVNAGKCRQVKAHSTSTEKRTMLELDHPVVNINWYDVTEDFIPYINSLLNENFALPSMAQWLAYSFNAKGERLSAKYVHCKDCERPFGEFKNTTISINGLPTGPFELYHVYGNAQEWLQDCWQDVKLGLQRCDQAPAVGGSWIDTEKNIEQQPFKRLLKTARSTTTGFRLVKRETNKQ